jgi:siderophore ferric iron reductase
MRIGPWICAALVVLGVYHWYSSRELVQAPGVLAADQPRQSEIDSAQGIERDGFRLVPQPMVTASPEAMIGLAATQLKALTDEMFVAVNALEKLRPIPARRLFADRMLGLMVWLGQRRRDLTPDAIEAYAVRWLDLLDLTGQGQLERVSAGQRTLLITRRKGCCLDYLIDPDRLCANCPRQDPQLRIARQTANALAELD